MPLPILKITDDLRGLTLHGPWGWAIIEGWKQVENRSWNPSFRGRIAIQIGHSRQSDESATAAFRKLKIPFPPEFPRGLLIGTVDLVDVLPLPDYLRLYGNDPIQREFALGPFCWVLRSPLACQPIRCPGNFQLWNVRRQLSRLKS